MCKYCLPIHAPFQLYEIKKRNVVVLLNKLYPHTTCCEMELEAACACQVARDGPDMSLTELSPH